MVDSMNLSEIDHSHLQTLLSTESICDICIGRIFSRHQSKDEYRERGHALRGQYITIEETSSSSCVLCDGLFDEEHILIDLINKAVKEYEFSTFVVGFHVDEDILEKEEKVFSLFPNNDHESIKTYLKRSIGSFLEKRWKKEVSFDHADIMVVVNTMFHVVDLQIKPLFIYGRYNKFKRGIPQSKWFCRTCRGVGCRVCMYTGTLYETSVEELITKTMMDHAEGSDEAFHGSGREDIDVKMLGSGRPFVVEISNPHKRTLDLGNIADEINKTNTDVLSISQLRFSDRNEIKRIKESKFSKVYEVTFEGEFQFDIEKLKKVAQSLRGTIIQQFTPTRVARRRANKVRQRQIFECTVVSVMGNRACFRIESESGTYIKELVNGDNGRTTPNLSDLIGCPCSVITLDVMEIKGE